MSSKDASANMSAWKRNNHRTTKIGLLIIGIVSLLIIVFSGQLHYIDPQYIAFRQYIGSNDNCSFMKSAMQQDTYLQGTKDSQLLKQTYQDQNCGNPDKIPKLHSVIVNADNIQTITRDDLDFEHIPQGHTIVIDCIIWSISEKEDIKKFDTLMNDNGCIMSSANSAYLGHWRYFN